jgi:hypothetical protein
MNTSEGENIPMFQVGLTAVLCSAWLYGWSGVEQGNVFPVFMIDVKTAAGENSGRN